MGKFESFFSARLGSIEYFDKILFFCRTNKGGNKSGADPLADERVKKSKLVPIMRLVQRRLLWTCKIVDTNDSNVLNKIASELKKRQRLDDSVDYNTENVANEDDDDNDVIFDLL